MRHSKINLLIVALLVFVFAFSATTSVAQDKATKQQEKESIKLFFNSLGDLVAAGDDLSEEEGRKFAAEFIRSIGQVANCGLEDGELSSRIALDLFNSIGDIVEFSEDSEQARIHVAGFMRNIGRVTIDETGKVSTGKLFNLLAKVIEKDGFQGDDKLEKEFLKELFNTLGDIAADDIEIVINDDKPVKP